MELTRKARLELALTSLERAHRQLSLAAQLQGAEPFPEADPFPYLLSTGRWLVASAVEGVGFALFKLEREEEERSRATILETNP